MTSRRQRSTGTAMPRSTSRIAQLTQTFFLEHMTFVRSRSRTTPSRCFRRCVQALREVDRTQPIGSIVTMDAHDRRDRRRAAVSGAAHRRVLGVRAAARGDRDLRRRRVFGRGAHARDRDSRGTRCRRIVTSCGWSCAGFSCSWFPGVALGVAGALAATRVLATLLFEVKPNDPATFAAVAALLAGVAIRRRGWCRRGGRAGSIRSWR